MVTVSKIAMKLIRNRNQKAERLVSPGDLRPRDQAAPVVAAMTMVAYGPMTAEAAGDQKKVASNVATDTTSSGVVSIGWPFILHLQTPRASQLIVALVTSEPSLFNT